MDVNEELFSIQEVSRISGVTSRTLRYYDEIELLKPDAQSKTAMRLYSKENLLRLQRILLLKELGLSLLTIAEVLSGEKSDLAALEEHLEHLHLEEERLGTLRRTAQKTVDALKGDLKMPAEEMFEGFTNDPYTDEAERNWPDQYVESNRRLAALTRDEQKALFQKGTDTTKELAYAFSSGSSPESESVQKLIAQHYKWICAFWTPNKEAYIALGQMYVDDPRFTAHYDKYAPGLAPFVSAAIKVFVENTPSPLENL